MIFFFVELKTDENSLRNSENFQPMEIFVDAKPKDFLLIQLPDALPGRLPESEDNDGDVKMKSQESLLGSKTMPTNLCNLNDIEEGMIGKIVRHKSGKTKLLIGDAVYDIEQGLASDFHQSIFSVTTNSEERSSNFYNFGNIKNKMIISPDWKWLFQKL